jgi:hypothetical protein
MPANSRRNRTGSTHRSLRSTGHLFERRYKAKLVDVDAYFLTLLRYIHLNPAKALETSNRAQLRGVSYICQFRHRIARRIEAHALLSTRDIATVHVEDVSRDEARLR